jgi:hypothetical protein
MRARPLLSGECSASAGVVDAALTGGEHPGSRGQLRWDVNDVLAVSEQPVGNVLADAGTALDRPDPVWPLPAASQHRGIAVAVGAEPAATDDHLILA